MKNIYLWILVAAVVVVAVIYFWSWKGFSLVFEETPSPSPTPFYATQGGQAGSSVTSPQVYSNLVKQYEGKRIQFDERCQAFPNDITFKNGTSVMFDNRSSVARNINVGGTVYSLPAYGYRIVSLTSSTLPKTLNVNCGSSPNVGRILLQAIILQ